MAQTPTTSSFYARLKGHIPDKVFAELPNTCSRFQINGPLRLSHFCGQVAHESANWTAVRENLNYSAEGLVKVFKKYFPTIESTKGYARNPERIANKVYANRMGNGPESSGDGYRHRGMGYIQTTGKKNQQEFFTFVGLPVDSDPDLIATTYPFASAAFFFLRNNIWSICDKGVDIPTITLVTRKVNGGDIGLRDRILHTQEYYRILTT